MSSPQRRSVSMSTISRRSFFSGITVVGLAVGGAALMHTPAISGAKFFIEDAAIRGYDPVAYFTEGEATLGDSEFRTEWQGVIWQFASKENLDLFLSDPEKYTPKYGGFCAYAASEGYIASTDPLAWTIVDGRLYLNYSIEVRGLWRENPGKRIADADKNWPGLREEL